MRADHRAAVALHAQVGFPDRDLQCDGPLLVAAGSCRPRPIGRERADRETVAVIFQQQPGDALHELGGVVGHGGTPQPGGVRDRGHRDLVHGRGGGIDGGGVATNDLGAPLSPCRGDRFLHPRGRVVEREHSTQREEAHLHDRVDPTPEPVLLRKPVRVDRRTGDNPDRPTSAARRAAGSPTPHPAERSS